MQNQDPAPNDPLNETPAPPPNAPPTRQVALPAQEQPPMSAMAVASLVLGVLGFCTGITAVVGLILGIAAVRKVRQSAGRLRGEGIAIAGTAVSGGALVTSLVAAVLWVAMLLPAVGVARQAANQARATSEARRLSGAMVQYHIANSSSFPPADTWRSALGVTPDPAADGTADGFAMNAMLHGLHASAIAFPQRTVMLFETTPGSPSAGGRDLLPDQPRHEDGFAIVFVDSTVELVPADQLDTLIWDPVIQSLDDADPDEQSDE